MLNKKKILFRFGSDIQPLTRFGEIVLLYSACYFRGKELGYEDGNIFFEWPTNMEYEIHCPKNTILPIEFIDTNDINISIYDRVINLTDTGVFYEDSSPLFKISNPLRRDHYAFLNYFNKYYIQYNKRPIFNIDKDKVKEDYILILTRNVNYSEIRNSNKSTYIHMINLIRKRYKNYKLYRCGEISPYEPEFNSLFDCYFKHSTNFNDFLRLMNDCTLYMGCDSGPINYAYSFGKPIVQLDISKTVDWGYLKDTYVGMGDFYSKKFWKNCLQGKYGDTVDYHIDKNTYLKLFRGDKIHENVVYDFMDKWLS